MNSHKDLWHWISLSKLSNSYLFRNQSALSPVHWLKYRRLDMHIVIMGTPHIQMAGVRFPAETENFSLRHRIQTGSGAHPASYPIGTGGSLPGVQLQHVFKKWVERCKKCIAFRWRYFEKETRHRTSTKFRLGVMRWIHELFKRPS
jgi:hypothetical protein